MVGKDGKFIKVRGSPSLIRKCWDKNEETSITTISSYGSKSRADEFKVKRFKERLEEIKANGDEYLAQQIIEETLDDLNAK